MTSLWLVIPVQGRMGITRICLEQKAHLAAELAARGIAVDVLVVGDDANLATARELGFHTLQRPNVLGRKLNDGFEWACRQGGADYVSFVGSDDWMLPDFMASLPSPGQVRTSRFQAFVSPAGDQLIVKRINGSMGGAPWIIPAAMLERVNYRPVYRDHKTSGMDFLIFRSLSPPRPRRTYNSVEKRERAIAYKRAQAFMFDHRPADELRMVDFKGTREQITRWHTVVPRQRSALVRDEADVWGTLATRYPAELVQRMQALYARGDA